MDETDDSQNIVVELIAAFRQREGDTRECSDDRLRGLTAFARAMGVSVQAVKKWISKRCVPPSRILRAEEISGVPRQRILSALCRPSVRVATPLSSVEAA